MTFIVGSFHSANGRIVSYAYEGFTGVKLNETLSPRTENLVQLGANDL